MRGQGTIRVAVAFAALLASLALVVSRQSSALDALRELDAVRSARAVAESERAELVTRIQKLESRGRVVDVARDRLGMKVPAAGAEIVVLLREAREPRASAAPVIASAAAERRLGAAHAAGDRHDGAAAAGSRSGPSRVVEVVPPPAVAAVAADAADGRVAAPIVRTRSGGGE